MASPAQKRSGSSKQELGDLRFMDFFFFFFLVKQLKFLLGKEYIWIDTWVGSESELPLEVYSLYTQWRALIEQGYLYAPRICDENLLILCKTVWRKAFHSSGWGWQGSGLEWRQY